MYMCIHACMYIHMYVYTYKIHTHMRTYLRMYVFRVECMHVHTYVPVFSLSLISSGILISLSLLAPLIPGVKRRCDV